jgi:hypothetical protein
MESMWQGKPCHTPPKRASHPKKWKANPIGQPTCPAKEGLIAPGSSPTRPNRTSAHARCGLAGPRHSLPSRGYLILFYFFAFLLLNFIVLQALALSKGLGFLRGCLYSTPIFWSLPLHLEVWNLPILMELGDFIFFKILFLLKLENT